MNTRALEPGFLKSGGPQAVPQVDEQNVEHLQIVTLVLWLLPLGSGAAGFVLGYPVAQREQDSAAVSKTQIVDVAAPKAVLPDSVPERPPPSIAPRQDLAANPLAPEPVAEPQAPALAVALPMSAIAFAVPVEGLARFVEVSQAVYQGRVSGSGSVEGQVNAQSPHPPPTPPPVAAPKVPAIAMPPVMHLTLGEGEGNQPPPEYPREAALARQQGMVTLRFNVDETGRVTQVDIIAPCHFSLLNQAAARTVRERWHFSPGRPRVYEVPIEFQINE
jgi:TonB family protein